MNRYSRRLWVLTISLGVAINVLLAFVTYIMEVPLYIDSISTIGVAAIGGFFPGFATGLLTNIFCGAFNPMAGFYSILSIMMAAATVYITKGKYYKSKSRIFVLIVVLGFISGVLGGLLQLLLLGEPQFENLAEAADLISSTININATLKMP